jgi:hypothetical protein
MLLQSVLCIRIEPTIFVSVVSLIVRILGYYTQIIPLTFLCEPLGRIELFHTFLLLVEIEGHFSHAFETEDWCFKWNVTLTKVILILDSGRDPEQILRRC